MTESFNWESMLKNFFFIHENKIKRKTPNAIHSAYVNQSCLVVVVVVLHCNKLFTMINYSDDFIRCEIQYVLIFGRSTTEL